MPVSVHQLAGAALFVLAGAVVLAIFWVAGRFFRSVLVRALQRRNVPPDVVLLTARVTLVVFVVLGTVIGLATALQTANVAIAGVIAATIVASLGVQDLMRNYVSGFYLLLERNIRVGHEIEFNGRTGVVTDVRMRVTYLRSEEGDLMIVPNSELFNSAVVTRAAKGAGAAPAAASAQEKAPKTTR